MQFAEHPSSLSVLLSSHSSFASTEPLPQVFAQVVPAALHTHPASL
jgi:hypothetical protein